MNNKKYTYKQENNKDIVFEFTDLVVFAESALFASCGDTKVLITIANGGKSDKDYLPLKVDYLEKFYAKGEILGSKYNKREGKPSTEATLTARLIDRSIRPYFSKEMTNDLHIVVSVLSLGQYDPDILALNGVSLALMTSDIEWNGPVIANRVVFDKTKDGEYFINPEYSKREKAFSDSLISFKEEKDDLRVCMIENNSFQIKENDFLKVLEKSKEEAKKMKSFFDEILKYDGKIREKEEIEKRFDIEEENKTVNFLENIWSELYEKRFNTDLSLVGDREEIKNIKKDFFDIYQKKEEIDFKNKDKNIVFNFIDKKIKNILRNNILNNKKRIDGREIDQVRDLYFQAGGFSNIHHGTGIFYRGETRVMSILTIGSLDDALTIEGMEINTVKNFIHHYNFPPFSVGETGRLSSPKRREIGHGALAEKALKGVFPDEEEFPYAVRVVSEAYSSNGSTSMGSVTASSLALMDAGVPTEPVTGIAIGLVYEDDDKYQLITDILGIEDHYGDMDFKVAGTRNGITAIQLDIKNTALSLKMCSEILEEAKKARLYILDQMSEIIKEPKELTDKVDRVEKINIDRSKIGLLIGKGGVTIKKITKNNNVQIKVERNGEVIITGKKENIDKVKIVISDLLK